jgi:hypothetical protein
MQQRLGCLQWKFEWANRFNAAYGAIAKLDPSSQEEMGRPLAIL